MRITEISVKYGKTVSDGNYGSDRYDISYTALLGEKDNPDLAQKILWSKAKKFIHDRVDGEEDTIKKIKKIGVKK